MRGEASQGFPQGLNEESKLHESHGSVAHGAGRWWQAAIGLAVCLAATGPASAAEQPVPTFQGEERVTAIDAVIEARNRTGAVPGELKPEDLVTLESGTPATVVGVSRLAPVPGGEPWRIVLYFDLALATPANAQAAALNLAERAARLVELGTVEVWTADPAPRPLLAATREREEVENALARVLVERAGKDAISALRREALEELAQRGPGRPAVGEGSDAELFAAAVQVEVATVQASQDALLAWMATDPGAGPRALFWVGSGYDLDPARYYRTARPDLKTPAPNPRLLQETTTSLARSLAAYGWLVFPLPFADFGAGSKQASQQFEQFRRLQIDGINGSTAMLGTVTVPLGRKNKADDAAAKLAGPQLQAGNEPLADWADASGGRVIAKADELDALLESLSGRFRVTFQVARDLDGQLRPLEIKARQGGLDIRGPRWVRSATPEGVTEARVRRILAGEPEVGSLAVSARFQAEPASSGRPSDGLKVGTLRLGLDLTRRGSRPPEPASSTLRLTIAYGREDGAPSISHEVLSRQDLSGATWSYEKALTLPEDAVWLIVVVEDLASGEWGARDLEP